MENADINSVVDIDSNNNYTIFDENSKKVISKKRGGFWKGFSFGRKKKNNDDGEKPIVIDYDYDTETEEIIPIVQEKKKQN